MEKKIKKDWKFIKINKFGSFYGGLKDKSSSDFGYGKPFLTYMQIFNNEISDKSKYGYVNIKKNEKQNPVNFGDILFTSSSETSEEIGTSSVYLSKIEKPFLNSFCFGLRPKKISEYNQLYIHYFLKSNFFRQNILRLAQGSTRYNLPKKELKKLNIFYPDLSSQNRISKIIFSIDTTLMFLKKHIDKLKLTRKSLINDLNKENIKKIEIKKISYVSKVLPGYAFKSVDQVEKGARWLKIANVGLENIVWKEISFLPESYLSKFSKYLLKKDDLVMAMTRPILGDELKIAKIKANDANSLLNQRVCKIIPNNKILPEYLYYYFKSSSFVSQISKIIEGTDPPNLSSDQIENFNIILPSIKEQKKIVNLISSVSDNIFNKELYYNKILNLKNTAIEDLISKEINRLISK